MSWGDSDLAIFERCGLFVRFLELAKINVAPIASSLMSEKTYSSALATVLKSFWW